MKKVVKLFCSVDEDMNIKYLLTLTGDALDAVAAFPIEELQIDESILNCLKLKKMDKKGREKKPCRTGQ